MLLPLSELRLLARVQFDVDIRHRHILEGLHHELRVRFYSHCIVD